MYRFKVGDILIYESSNGLYEMIYVLLEDQKEYTNDLLSGSLVMILDGKGLVDEKPGQTYRLRGIINYSRNLCK